MATPFRWPSPQRHSAPLTASGVCLVEVREPLLALRSPPACSAGRWRLSISLAVEALRRVSLHILLSTHSLSRDWYWLQSAERWDGVASHPAMSMLRMTDIRRATPATQIRLANHCRIYRP